MTKAKRKSPTRKRKPARRVKKSSAFDRLLKKIPLSDAQLQRVLTWGFVVAGVGALFIGAELIGLPAKIERHFADSAARAGFEVKRVEVTGIERVDELKVYEIVLAQKDRAMPLVDLGQVREDLLQYGWIRDARVTRRLPDTLAVDIVEREPAAVWQNGGELSLIDAEGVVLETIAEGTKPDLPLIIGPEANRRSIELAELMESAPALKPLVVSASWIGNRRWNLEFDTGETLALPEGPGASAEALAKFARMDGVNRLLGRGIEHFDFRDPERAYLRMPSPTGGGSDANDI